MKRVKVPTEVHNCKNRPLWMNYVKVKCDYTKSYNPTNLVEHNKSLRPDNKRAA